MTSITETHRAVSPQRVFSSVYHGLHRVSSPFTTHCMPKSRLSTSTPPKPLPFRFLVLSWATMNEEERMMEQEQQDASTVEGRIPNKPRRYCPMCGAQVAPTAKTCVMCGADLSATPKESAAEVALAAEESAPAPRRLSRVAVGLLVGLAVLVMAGLILAAWTMTQGAWQATPTPAYTPTPSPTPSITPTPSLTPTPSATPTPTVTPTPLPPIEYVVKRGDTLSEIAQQFDVTTDSIMDLNGRLSDAVYVGETLLIPRPTPTPDPFTTPAPYLTHIVKNGENLSGIAKKYNVSVEDIRLANNMPEFSYLISPGQALIIPRYTPTPTPTATPTPYIVKATPQPVYSRIALLYPISRASFAGKDTVIMLQWASVGILNAKESYRLEVTYPDANGPQTLTVYLKATAWRVPQELFPPDQVRDRTFTWQVSVVRRMSETGDYQVLPQTVSEKRSFSWWVTLP